MPQIVAVRTKDVSSRDIISVVLSQDAVCLGPDGQPWAGVALNAQLARSLAQRLLGLANELDAQGQKDSTANPSLAQISSVLIFHDGSSQGHRAFSLAFDIASRSLASIKIAVIYGIQESRFAPSEQSDDYEWQKGWMERLVKMYSSEAAQARIELHSTLVAANDEQQVAELFNARGFDLIVLPRRFSEVSVSDDASRKFQQQFAGATESTILLCP